MSQNNPFIYTESPSAHERTPQQWVDFYLNIENEVAQGKEFRSDVLNYSVVMDDLDAIRKARREWQRVVQKTAKCGGRQIGGLNYKVADLSR